MRWNLLLQEFNSTIKYIKGFDNTVADAVLRLDYCPKTNPHPGYELGDDGEWKYKWNNMMKLMTHYQDQEEVDDEAETVADGLKYKEVLAHVFQVEKEDKDTIYHPITTQELVDAQRSDPKL
jgi:hypothetical protein